VYIKYTQKSVTDISTHRDKLREYLTPLVHVHNEHWVDSQYHYQPLGELKRGEGIKLVAGVWSILYYTVIVHTNLRKMMSWFVTGSVLDGMSCMCIVVVGSSYLRPGHTAPTTTTGSLACCRWRSGEGTIG